MRKILPVAVLFGLVWFVLDESGFVDRRDDGAAAPVTGTATDTATTGESALAKAYAARRSNVQVEGRGQVVRVLSDDVDGDRHQRFILRLPSGQTLLIAHNIDLAPRLASLDAGDSVEFFGEYEWNEQGGVIHWTHRDPQGRHVAGWLRHDGRTYQ
jgi:hypothetical protein